MKKYFLYTNKVSDQRQIVSGEDLVEKEPDGQAYSSLFYYDHYLVEYLTKNGSISGYDGNIYQDYFIMDFDGNKKEVSHAIVPFLEYLQVNEVQYELFFSGNKGFHIYIPKQYVKYDKDLENKFNIASKLFAIQIAKEFRLEKYIDLVIYDAVRIFRFPFSKHQNGNRKTYVDWDRTSGETFKEHWRSPDIDEEFIKEILFTDCNNGIKPKEVFEIDSSNEISFSRTSNKSKDYFRYIYGDKYCIIKMLNDHSMEKNSRRHIVALRLMAHFKNRFPYEYVKNILVIWNKNIVDPLPAKEIDAIMKYYDKPYNYGCHDVIMKRYCDRNCKYYKTKDYSKGIPNPTDYSGLVTQELNRDTSADINFASLYPNIKVSVRPGEIVVLAACAQVGKTTFLMNMLYHYTHTNWLFLSYEMKKERLLTSSLKPLGIDTSDPHSIRKINNKLSHVYIEDMSSRAIRAEDINNYIELISSNKQKEIKAIAIDYFDLVPAQGQELQRQINIMNELKRVAKQQDVQIFILSQVPKEAGGNGDQPLSLQSPKGSGEIVNLADVVLTFYRPNINREEPDNEFVVQLQKTRYVQGHYQVTLKWEGNNGLILPNRYLQQQPVTFFDN